MEESLTLAHAGARFTLENFFKIRSLTLRGSVSRSVDGKVIWILNEHSSNCTCQYTISCES